MNVCANAPCAHEVLIQKLPYKAETLYRWNRHADEATEKAQYMRRKINAASCIDWERADNTLQIIADASHCLDNITEELS